MSRALSYRFARLEGNSRGGETGVVVFPLRLDADRAARGADLTRSGVARASDCFLPIWQSASANRSLLSGAAPAGQGGHCLAVSSFGRAATAPRTCKRAPRKERSRGRRRSSRTGT